MVARFRFSAGKVLPRSSRTVLYREEVGDPCRDGRLEIRTPRATGTSREGRLELLAPRATGTSSYWHLEPEDWLRMLKQDWSR